MRRRHEGAAGGAGHVEVEGEVLQDVLLGLAVRRPAVEQLAVRGIARDGHDVGAELQKRGQQPVAALPALGDGLLHQPHGLVHVAKIAADGVRHLGHGLGAAGLGALHHGAAVAVQEQGYAADEYDRHRAHDHGHEYAGYAQLRAGRSVPHAPSPALPESSLRRMALGDSPQYFLKQ